MTQHEARRTLVKSPPELWAECSDADSLGRHLDQFGDIRITRLEPETAVAWEGELASGTVRLEPSGWGTKVILTAEAAEEERTEEEVLPEVLVKETEIEAVAAPVATPEAAAAVPDPEPEPDPMTEVDPEVDPDPMAEVDPDPGTGSVAAGSERPKGLMGRLRRWFSAPQAPEPIEAPAPIEAREPIEAPAPDEPEPLPPAAEAPHEPETPEPPPPAAEVPSEPLAGEPAVDASAALSAALDSLGQAHHRPFSRA